jgi:hypothetical protein
LRSQLWNQVSVGCNETGSLYTGDQAGGKHEMSF